MGGITLTLEVGQVVRRHRRRRSQRPLMHRPHKRTRQTTTVVQILISTDVSHHFFNTRPFARTIFVPCFVLYSIGRSQLDLLISLEPVSPDFGFVQMNEHLPQYTKVAGDM
jgi:hypothetical protein